MPMDGLKFSQQVIFDRSAKSTNPNADSNGSHDEHCLSQSHGYPRENVRVSFHARMKLIEPDSGFDLVLVFEVISSLVP